MSFIQAVNQATVEEMRLNPRVFVMGTDVTSGLYGDYQVAEFGAARVRNTPISELGVVGAAIGAAMTGTRPIVEVGSPTFLYCAMDQVANQASKIRYMFGGQTTVPIVIRMTVSYMGSMAAHHSDRSWALFAQIPGLKIIVPTTPYDAKGLLKSAIRDDNPVLWFEDGTVKGKRGEVPDKEYTIPIGVADVKREGTDVTIVAVGGAVYHALAAAETLQGEGISAEVIDVRTIVPLDRETILRSVKKTGRLVVVDPSPGMCSVPSEIAALVVEKAFDHLKSRVIRLVAPDIPVPFSPALERLMYPTAVTVADAVRELCGSGVCSK